MRHISLLAVSLLALAACTPEKQQEADDYTQYVNPFIGTDFTGNTYPGAQVPFGMVQLSPDNGLPGWDRISGYFYPDTTIAGFSHTHLSGTGAGDLYDISFMPVTRPYKEAPAPLGVYSTFSHNDEMASAGYYRVLLKDYNINVELTATERCGIQRYTFPKAEASVFLNLKKAMNWDFTLDSYIEVVDSMTIRGYRFSQGWSPLQHVYFETRFSKPFMACHMDTTSIVTKDRGRIGTAYIARFDFNTEKDEEILVTTGISGVSMEGAGKNLRAEVSKDDFDYYQAQAAKTWNKQLSKIEVKSSDTDDLVKFYTALYHSMIAPTIYSDVDGSYYGPDQQIHKADGWTNYSTFSLWDTYRASHPLFTYTEPERANDMIKGFLKFYEQNGALPLWNLYGWETNMMIGYHAVPVIVDAYLKGIGNFDPEKALEACIATANRDDYRGIGDYKKLGYVPAYGDPKKWENWSLSKTLEYAYDDYCIATMAKKMGKKEIADEFYKRAQNYRNVYNPATSFMQPRDEKGNFAANFSPDDYTEDICESNGWQYFWSVPQDLDGLVGLVGSKERFAEKLDSMFTYVPKSTEDLPIFSTGMIGQYAHGNEPSHHVIYLYNKVEGIEKKANEVSKLVPEAKVGFAHGKMTGKELEQIMLDFIQKKINVLVCTTILESGIDIPNANTIIVENADRLGLAQLYQIRGRVGRSDRQAYAYITYKREKLLSEVADKRLKAIKEFTEFGSGFKIAMRDLEIRGAGSLLGEIQHGHMEQVGYDTYCRLLDEVVKEIQGIEVKEEQDIQIDIDVSSYIPDSFIDNNSQKIEIYQNIALCRTEEDIQNVIDEIIDRYGHMPSELENLIEIARIKNLCRVDNVIKISQRKEKVVFYFDKAKFNPEIVDKLIKKYNTNIRFSTGIEPYVTVTIGSKIIEEIKEFLTYIQNCTTSSM